MTTAPRIAFVLIHNNDPQRLAHVRPACRALAQSFGAQVNEIFEQPEIVPLGRVATCRRHAEFELLGRRWKRYRRQPVGPLRRWATDTTREMRHILFGRTDDVARRRRAVAIDTILADKHIAAWRTFGPAADYIVLFEDDALFLPDSIARFAALTDRLAARDRRRDLYVDLAGGVPLPDLQVDALITGRQDGFVTFSLPVTNTTCSYLVSSETARRFCTILDRRPWFQGAPVDWLINGLLMTAVGTGAKFDCMHADPPIFVHGSAQRAYASSRQRE
jgi:hypothetical protein